MFSANVAESCTGDADPARSDVCCWYCVWAGSNGQVRAMLNSDLVIINISIRSEPHAL